MNGIKIKTIVGNNYETGLALGRLGRKAFMTVVRNLTQYRTLQNLRGSDRMAGLLRHAQSYFPRLVDELRGIAEGLGSDFEAVFLWNCRGDFRDLTDQIRTSSGAQGCTTLIIPSNEAAEYSVIAHNEDGVAALDGHGFIADVKVDNAPGFFAFCYPGMLPGHAFGVNKFGLVEAINNIRCNDLKIGVPRHLIARAILDCSTLEEAITLLKKIPRASGFHYNLGQPGRGLASVETSGGSHCVTIVKKPSVHANHLTGESMSHVDQIIHPSSASRQKQAEKLLRKTKNSIDLFDILYDERHGTFPILQRGKLNSNDGYTLATSIFEIDKYSVCCNVYRPPQRTAKFTCKIP